MTLPAGFKYGTATKLARPLFQQLDRKKMEPMMTTKSVFSLFCTFHVCLSILLYGQTTKEHADTIITGGIVVTMDAQRHIYDDGSVVVTGDAIVAVGPRAELEARYESRQTIDAKNALVLPGFINGHTHAPMTLLRGLHDDVTLNDWLYKYIFPAEKKNVTEEFVRWGTRLAAAEQIRSGVTTFADMYYFEDAVAEETKAAGMRGVLGETFIDFPAPDNKTEAAMLEYTEKFLKKWQGDPLIHAAPAPHSIYTCSQKTLQDAAALARKYHAPILIHVAEMKKERDDSEKQNGMSPVQYREEIDLAAKLAKITKMSPLALNALAVVEMATIDGARALHMEKEIGSLEKGKKADLILISLDEPNAVPMYDIYAQVAYALKASDVQTVMIGGRIVMRDHKLLTVDEREAVAMAREYKKAIATSLGMQ